MLWLADHLVRDQIDQFKKLFGHCFVVGKIKLTGVNRIVSNYPNYIQCMLNALIKSSFH